MVTLTLTDDEIRALVYLLEPALFGVGGDEPPTVSAGDPLERIYQKILDSGGYPKPEG